MCNTPHARDHLCVIWKESIQNCGRYRADMAYETDGPMSSEKLFSAGMKQDAPH